MMRARRSILRQLINAKGWSDAEFARHIGVNRSYVCNVINNNQPVGSKFIRGVLEVFDDVKYEDLFFFDMSLNESPQNKSEVAE